MKKFFKWSAVGLVLFFFTIKFTACLQFRDSPKKVEKEFSKAGYEYQLKSIQVSDRTLNYLRTGFANTSKPVVVFIHGSPGSLNNFYNNLFDSVLQENFEMYSIDRPGFGYSDFGRSLPSLKGQSDLISVLLDSIGNRNIILVGHSYGGPLIGQLAVDYPNLVSGLILVGGSIDPDLEPKKWWRKPMNTAIGRFLIPKSFTVSNEEILTLKEDLIDLKPKWSEIEIPVTVLQGEKDVLVPLENADFAEEQITNSDSLIIKRIPKVNHFIPFKQSELITEALMDMLKLL